MALAMSQHTTKQRPRLVVESEEKKTKKKTDHCKDVPEARAPLFCRRRDVHSSSHRHGRFHLKAVESVISPGVGRERGISRGPHEGRGDDQSKGGGRYDVGGRGNLAGISSRRSGPFARLPAWFGGHIARVSKQEATSSPERFFLFFVVTFPSSNFFILCLRQLRERGGPLLPLRRTRRRSTSRRGGRGKGGSISTFKQEWAVLDAA